MDTLKESGNSSLGLSVEDIIKGLLTLEQSEAKKSLNLIQKGLRNLDAQNRVVGSPTKKEESFRKFKTLIFKEKEMEKIKVYRSNKGELSFKNESPIEVCRGLWNFNNGLSTIATEKAKEFEIPANPANIDHILVRIWTRFEKNVPIDKDILAHSEGRRLFSEVYLNDICCSEVKINPHRWIEFLLYLENNGVKEIYFAYAISIEKRKWRLYKTFCLPLTIKDEVGHGHPLHYPQGEYVNVGMANEVFSFDSRLGFLPYEWNLDEVYVLLYPDGSTMLTNGIAGNPTYWVKVE